MNNENKKDTKTSKFYKKITKGFVNVFNVTSDNVLGKVVTVMKILLGCCLLGYYIMNNK